MRLPKICLVHCTLFLICVGFFLWSGKSEALTTPNPERVAEVMAGERNEASAAWWGFDSNDATEFIQAAIDSGVRRLIIPNMGHDWIIRPITLRSNLELILEDGVVVSAKKGEFRGRNDSLFTARDVENLIIRGYGATLQMQKEDYDSDRYQKAEWRMGISIRGSKNVQILGLTIRDTGGDGIYLGRGSQRSVNEDVIIRDIIADNNYRQGISVISAKNLLIEDSVFRNTGGTAPMAGIDLEPNHPDEQLVNIIVRNSVFENNQGPGIHMYLKNLNSSSEPVSVLWENVLVQGSTVGINLNYGNSSDFVRGEITVRNCIVEESQRNGIGIRNKNDGGALTFTVENCLLYNVATNGVDLDNLQASVPIYISADSELRGINFHDVVVIDEQVRPALYGQLLNPTDHGGFSAIEADLRVLNPYGAQVMWDGPTQDVSVIVKEQDSLTIDYTQFVTHPEYVLSPLYVQLQPTIYIKFPLMTRPPSVVQGQLVPNIELRHFQADDLKQVDVYVDDQLIFSGERLPIPGELRFDTTTLHDTQHQLHVVAESEALGAQQTTAVFSTRNFSQVYDLFEGPKQVAWFGSVYNPKTIEQSSGWVYATDRPEDFHGDPHRKLKKDDTEEYLLWETPRLHSFELEVYAPNREALASLEIKAGRLESTDPGSQISYTVEDKGSSPAGWHKFVLRNEENLSDEDLNYVRLNLRATDTSAEIHLGQILFHLLRE